jgi:hypothetical protein
MSRALDRTAFLAQEPTRLLIAELCQHKALTHAAIARQLQRSPGSLSQPKTMLKHRALVKVNRKKASKAQRAPTFRLNKSWWKNVEEAKQLQRPARLSSQQVLLLIPLRDTPAACAALASGIEDVAWGARVSGGTIGLILAPSADVNGAATVRVVAALGEGARDVWELRLEDMLGPADLRRWATRSGRAPRRLPLTP